MQQEDAVDRHTPGEDAFTRAGQRLAGVPRGSVLAGCLAGVLLIGGLDAAVDPLLAMSALYLVPVLVAAMRDAVAGWALAAGSAAVWCSVDLLRHGDVYTNAAVPLANAAARLVVFGVVVWLVVALLDQAERARALSRCDALTGLLTTRAFYEVVEAERRTAARTGQPLTLAYLDVDDFKSVNDRHGHTAGDEVLRSIAQVLRTTVREVDAVGRLGGDEFAVVMPGTDADGAAHLLDRVLERVAEVGDTGLSVGATTFAAPPPDVDAMVREADNAMYAQKRAGKNGVRVVAR